MELPNLVSKHAHSSKANHHVFDEQVAQQGHEFAVAIRAIRALRFNSTEDKEFSTVVLVIIVKRCHTIGNMENVCQFSICQELKYIGQLLVYVSAEALSCWFFRVMEEAAEDAEPEASYSFCVP